MEQDAFVSIRNLTKRFGDQVAVNDISLNVAEGHTLALLGPSGCGKTTILRCLAGLETPDAGHISLAGNVVFDHAARRSIDDQRLMCVVHERTGGVRVVAVEGEERGQKRQAGLHHLRMGQLAERGHLIDRHVAATA